MIVRALIAFAVVFSTVFSQTADGQRLESAAVGLRSRLDTQTIPTFNHSKAATDTADRRSRVVHGMRVGALMGAAAGLFSAVILTSGNTDHSWDGLTYAGLISVGALVGLTLGALAGAVRGP
jgi:hypothetical protein